LCKIAQTFKLERLSSQNNLGEHIECGTFYLSFAKFFVTENIDGAKELVVLL
jgi:hypothetical protein